MQMLSNQLSRSTGRPVVDKTGLTGKYDFTLQWTPEPGTAGTKEGMGGPGQKADAIGAPPLDPSGPSLFTAVQEQLGLKLESQKGTVVTIIVDRLEKPSEN